MLSWMQKNNKTVYLIAFLIMIISPILMYFAVRSGQLGWLYFPLSVFVLGNIILLFVR